MSRLPCLLIVVVLGVSWLRSDDTRPVAAAPAPPVETPAPALPGSAMAITIKSDPAYGIYLQDVRLQRVGESDFFVGTGVDSGMGEWSAGRRVWVAVEDISEIVEFQDQEDLRKTLVPVVEGPDA